MWWKKCLCKRAYEPYTLSGIPGGEPPSCEAPQQPTIYLKVGLDSISKGIIGKACLILLLILLHWIGLKEKVLSKFEDF